MPATLPCPKIPQTPAKNCVRRPSRSTCWFFRNRTSACAIVKRSVFIPSPLSGVGQAFSPVPPKPKASSFLIRIRRHTVANHLHYMIVGAQELAQRAQRRAIGGEMVHRQTVFV